MLATIRKHAVWWVSVGLILIILNASVFTFNQSDLATALSIPWMLFVSLICTGAVELLWAWIHKLSVKEQLQHSKFWITSLILICLLPVGARLYAVIIASLVAEFLAKLLFGRANNVFNPAGIGYLFIFIAKLVTQSDSLSTALSSNHWMVYDSSVFFATNGSFINLFFANHSGPIGSTNSFLVLLLGVLFVGFGMIRRRTTIVACVTTIVCLTIETVVLHGSLWTIPLQLISGSYLFVLIFMLSDPVTSPSLPMGQILYGAFFGAAVVLLRVVSPGSESAVLALLVLNIFSATISLYTFKSPSFTLKKKVSIYSVSGLVVLALVFVISPLIPKPEVIETPELPPQTAQLSSADDYSQQAAVIESKSKAGAVWTYVVKAKGYGAIHEASQPNKFTIIVDTDRKVIVSVTVDVNNDTEEVGDAINKPTYLAQFSELSYAAEVKTDIASHATYSAKSVMAAVQAVLKAVEG